MNPRPRRPGYYPAPFNPGAPTVNIIKDPVTRKYTFKIHLPPDEEKIYRQSQVFRIWESSKLSELQGRDLDAAARRKELKKLTVKKEKEKSEREERQRKYEEWKRQKALEESGEGTSTDTGRLRLGSIMDSYRGNSEDEEDGFDRYKAQLMSPSIAASLRAKSNGAQEGFRSPYAPTEREMMLDRIALQESANFKEPALPSTSNAKPAPRRMEHAVIPDYNQPSTSSAIARSSMEDESASESEEEQQVDMDDEDFVPPPTSAQTTSSKYSLRVKGTQTTEDEVEYEEPAPRARRSQEKKPKVMKEETKDDVVRIWRPIHIDKLFGMKFYQAEFPGNVLNETQKKQADKERDTLVYIEQGVHTHQAIRLTFYRALWRQFHGLITFGDALEHLMMNDYSIPKALASIDNVLRNLCSNFEPDLSLPEIKYQYLEPLVQDHQQSEAAALDGEYIFSEEDCKQFFWFCRDQHLQPGRKRRRSRKEIPCHCQDAFTKDLIYEPRWACSNCSKKDRGADRLCLICQLYQEQEGVPFPATNVHFTRHDLKQMKAWQAMETRLKRTICREEFEMLQMEEEEKWLERVRRMKKPHTDLPREEYTFVKKYYNLRRERAIRQKIPKFPKFERLGGESFAELLKPRRLTLFKNCDCVKVPARIIVPARSIVPAVKVLPPKTGPTKEMVVRCGEEEKKCLKTAVKMGIKLLMDNLDKLPAVEEVEEVETESRRTRLSSRGVQVQRGV